MAATLSLFGAIHFNREGVVREDLAETAADADALFVEFPAADPTTPGYWWRVAKVPAAFLGTVVGALLLQLPAFALFNRDLRSTELIAAEAVAGDRPLHAVDRHPLLVQADMGAVWTVGNWLALWFVLSRWPVTTVLLATAGTVSAFGPTLVQARFGTPRIAALLALGLAAAWIWLLVAGPLALAPVLVGYLALAVCALVTLDERNRTMLAAIAEVAAEEGYDRVCLATGYKHLPGLAATAHDHGLAVGTVFRSRWLRHGATVDRTDVAGRPRRGSFGHPTADVDRAGSVLGRRAAATLVDWAVVAVLAALAAAGAYLLGSEWLAFPALHAVAGATGLVAVASYHVATETLYGRTLGKRVVGLVVVGVDGSPVSRRQAVVRTLLRPVDFLPGYYVLGGTLAALTGRGRRLGDLAAGTTVAPVETDWRPVAVGATGSDGVTADGDADDEEATGSDDRGDGGGRGDDGSPTADDGDARDRDDGVGKPPTPGVDDGDEPAPA